MSLDLVEIRELAGNRWPSSDAASAPETWAEWSKSLHRFEHEDVMLSLFALSENQERFPSLARLIAACQVRADEREKAARPLLDPPKPVTTVARRLADFDRSAKEDRTRRHAELAVFARTHHVDDLAARHAAIDEIGPIEAHAREMLAEGKDPGESALAFVQAWTRTPGKTGGAKRAVADDLPPYVPEAPAEQTAAEIVDAWEMGEQIDVASMSAETRAACRAEVERRRQVQEVAT